MEEWKHLLRDDPYGWLLEEGNPSVRYFALSELLERADDDPEVVRTSGAIQ